MTIPEVRRRLLVLLKENDGDINSSDENLCKAVGVERKEYVKIQSALVALRDEGIISWMRLGNGVNQFTLLRDA